ncbi:hypothetical protein LCGC14_2116090 [marine sediment metagenome]|uniref:Uncharacterized protein n=1 Tax=marine sediment metagenome TaxID=412755 RepID=A0A0F9GIS7_9ZZZZ
MTCSTSYSARALFVEVGAGIHKVEDILDPEPGGLKWGHILAAVDAGHAEILPDPALSAKLPASCGSVQVRVFF